MAGASQKKDREPLYVASLIFTSRMEMIRPRTVALLLFLRRGWLANSHHFEPPLRFRSYRDASRRSGWSYGISITRPSPVLLKNWKALGMVRSGEVVGCRMVRRYELTAKGEQLLERVAPEILAEAKAIVRAAIWSVVLRRRSFARRSVRIEILKKSASSESAR